MKNHLIAIVNLLVVTVLLIVGFFYSNSVKNNYLNVQQELFVKNTDNAAKTLEGYFLREQQLIDSWASYINHTDSSLEDMFEKIRKATGEGSYAIHLIWLDDFTGYTTNPSLQNPGDYSITYNTGTNNTTSGDYIVTHIDYEQEFSDATIHMFPGFPDIATGVRVVGFFQKVNLIDDGQDREALLIRYIEEDSLQQNWNLYSDLGNAYFAIIDASGIYISRPIQMKNNNFYEFIFSYNKDKYGVSQISELMNSRKTGSFTALDKAGKETLYAWSRVETGNDDVIIICATETTGFRIQNDKWLVLIIGGVLIVLLLVNMVYFNIISKNEIALRKTLETQLVTIKEQDVKLKDALYAAENSNRAKSLFLNSMSHDIRTPMNAIIGFTNLASSCDDTPEKVKTYLSKINTSGKHLLNLINDVLDMSRIESGNVHVNTAKMNILDTIDEINVILHSAANEKNQKMQVIVTDVVHENVFADKLRINQILMNLLSNSLKYTGKGGTISLHLYETNCDRAGYSIYEFRIKDNGIGMSKEFQNHIFEPFTREFTSTVNKIQGTGLGMSITKNIVDMMNGTISVESEQGKGSEFIVRIPLEICTDTENDPHERNEECEEQIDFKGKKILLAEDNEFNREIACSILEDAGFMIKTVEDGDEAIEAVRNAQPGDYDLILMDIQMPKVDGYTATREIRNLPGDIGPNIPIIAVTANAFEEDRKEAIKSGMNGHISKPIKIPVLLKTMADLLR